jgi:FixJ family two-component response regulator
MLFTGYADLDSVIAAINQGHIFKFLKKPWEPNDLEQTVREAAAEYEHLVENADLTEKLRYDLQHLRERILALEKEVELLRKPG